MTKPDPFRIEDAVTQSIGGVATPAFIGKYRVLGTLGKGGMGVVYLAEDPVLGREVALKTLPDTLTKGSQDDIRLRREARLLASLSHPNIAVVYSLEEAEDRPFLTMEVVRGSDLSEILKSGPLSPSACVRVGRQISAGLEAAHATGVTHRDLKPGNVLVTAEGLAKVVDFGLGLLATEKEAATGSKGRVGTPIFMSPEQIRGETTDEKVDIWAFGCLLFQSLSGGPPFTADNIPDLFAQILDHDPLWKSLPSDTPTFLTELISSCLTKDPVRRISSMADVSRILEDDAPASVVDRSHTPVPTRSCLTFFLFENETADNSLDWLEYGIPTLLAMTLSQDSRLDIVAPQTALREARSGQSRASDFSLGLKVKLARQRSGGSGQFVCGRFSAVPGGIRFDLELHSAKTAKVVDHRSYETISGGAVSDCVDDFTDWITSVVVDGDAAGTDDLLLLPATEITTRNPEALRLFMEAERMVGVENDYEAGRVLLDEAIELDPTFAWAQYVLHHVLQVTNDKAREVAVMNELMKNRHRLPETYQFRVKREFYLRQGEISLASRVLQNWVRLYPTDPEAFRQLSNWHFLNDQMTEAIDASKKVLELDPADERASLRIIQLMSHARRHGEALSMVRQFLEGHPGHAKAHMMLAGLLQDTGELGAAREECETASTLEPDNIDILLEMAQLELDGGHCEDAHPILATALSIATGPEERFAVRSCMFSHKLQEGRIQEALEEMASARAEQGDTAADHQHIFSELVWVTSLAEAGLPDLAGEILDRLSQGRVSDDKNLLLFGNLLLSVALSDADGIDLSLAMFDERKVAVSWLKMPPGPIGTARGVMLELRGQLSAAAEQFRSEVDATGYRRARRGLARTLQGLGRLEEAKAEAQCLLQTAPGDPEVRVETARICHELGLRDEARNHLDHALTTWRRADSDFSPARTAREFRKLLDDDATS